MIALTKFVHITTIAIWTAGLIALPGLYRQLAIVREENPQDGVHGEAVLRLQRILRLIYVGIVSPAAFIAVGTGIFLIFQQSVVAPWFSVKLALVATLVVAHSLAGITLVRIFDQPDGYPLWRTLAATSTAMLIAIAIITLTLAKPQLSGTFFPAALSEPGALKPMIESFNPWKTP